MNDNYKKMQVELQKEIMALIGPSSSCYYTNGLSLNGETGFTQNIEAAIKLIRSDKIFWKLSYEYCDETGREHPVVRIVDDNDNELAYQKGFHSIPMLMCLAYRDMLKRQED